MPVISAGIPTIVDVSTLLYSIAPDTVSEDSEKNNHMMVTPREIDSFVADSAKLLAYGLNFALHKDLTLGDVDLFVG